MCEVTNASWFSLVMNAAAELEDAAISLRDPDAKRSATSGADYYRRKANDFLNECAGKEKRQNSTGIDPLPT